MGGAGHGAHVLHVRCQPGTEEPLYRLLLSLLREVSPVVQALPPGAALVDVAGAVRYFQRSPYELAQRIRLRSLARYGVDTHIGVAASWSVAAMASARPGPDGITVVEDTPEAVAGFLQGLPVEALHGIGPGRARAV